MSLSLVKSKRIRSGHKAHVRRVINEANELAGNYDRENPEHRSRIKHYKSTFAKKMEVIAGFNEQILTQVEEENIEAEIAESSEFMDEIDNLFDHTRGCIARGNRFSKQCCRATHAREFFSVNR